MVIYVEVLVMISVEVVVIGDSLGLYWCGDDIGVGGCGGCDDIGGGSD